MSDALDILRLSSANSAWGYAKHGATASEPAAWAALACASSGDLANATKAARWLQKTQATDGSVGVSATEGRPAWPTSLAILAWNYLDRQHETDQYQESIQSAVEWCLNTQGKTAKRQSEIGHDPSLLGWSWAEGTHSWLEPTAMFALALKSAGYWNHPRTREAVRLIVDRLLPDGGCNYGNTMVLGQTLLPHVQPTGLAMLALAGEEIDDSRIDKSLDFLTKSLNADTPIASLCYALLGLTAHSRRIRQAEELLAAASRRASNCYQAALITLASADVSDWLRPAARVGEVAAS